MSPYVTCYERFLSEHDLLGGGGVSTEQPPVDEASVPEVRVLALLSGERENLLDQLLGVGGSLQEELHYGGQQLQLHLTVLVMEILQETLQQLVSVVNPEHRP